MYISFIRPLLDGGPIWDNCIKEDKTHVESIQIEAMRIVTGATKLCSIAKLLNYTKIRDGKHFKVDVTNRNCRCSIKWFMFSLQVTLTI